MSAAAMAGAHAYAGYVALQVEALRVPMLALIGGLWAVTLLDVEADRRRAWCGCFLAIAAALHARVLGAEAAFVEIQLGLAAFVAGSASQMLIVPARRVPLAAALGVAVAVGLLVGAPAGGSAAVAGAVGGVLAGLRPGAALEVIVRGRSADPWLAWSPVDEEAR